MTAPTVARKDALGIADAAWESSPDGLVVVDPASATIVAVNPEAERLFARSRDELVGRPAYVLHPGSQHELAADVFADLQTDRPGVIELDLVRPSGERTVVEIQFRTWQARDGRRLNLGAIRDITARRTSERELRRRTWALAAMRHATSAAMEAESERELMEAVCRGLTAETPYDVAFVALADTGPRVSVRIAAISGDQTVPIDTALTERAIRLQATHVADGSGRAKIAVPLGEIHGALTVYAREDDAFGAFEQTLFEDVGRQLVLGMQVRRQRSALADQIARNERQTERMQLALEQTVAVIAATIEHRDPYTAGHGRAVGDLARRIGAEMGFTAERCHGLFLAGLVHDVGKIQIPTEILSKPIALWPEEHELLKTHAEAGYDILRSVDFPWPIAEATRQHHERLDGSGYPRGLRGDEIIVEARILAVADVVDSMCGRRPYRPALGMHRALAELGRAAGTELDAAVVDAMLRIASVDEPET